MQHKCKVTVIDKKVYPELQRQYCMEKDSGPCPCYNVGDEFIFERACGADDFWHMGLNTLRASRVKGAENETAGGRKMPHCSEAWDAVSRYIYTALQGGSIMRGWMEDERVMIACCSDGTRPVIFKIERLDYKILRTEGNLCRKKFTDALTSIDGVKSVEFTEDRAEVFLDRDVSDEDLKAAAEKSGVHVTAVE